MVSGIMQILCMEQHTENTLTWRMNDGYLLLWEGGRLLLLLQNGNRFPPGKRTRDRALLNVYIVVGNVKLFYGDTTLMKINRR